MKNKILLTVVTCFFLSLGVVLHTQPENIKRIGLDIPPKTFKESIKYIQDLEVGLIRINLPWQLVEPKQGEFDWKMTDQMVETAQKKQIEILFTLRSISSWGTKEETKAKGIYHSSSMPKDIKQWEHYIEALAERYKKNKVYYEIENEVNGEAFWSGTLEEYLELLKASYVTIRRINPKSIVLSSAMGCGIVRNFKTEEAQSEMRKRHDKWLKPILATKSFDVVSIHNYYFPSGIIANGYTFKSYIERIHGLMKETGVEKRAIWITEAGYVSEPTNAGDRKDNGSPEKQTEWLEQSYRQAIELGVERIFWIRIHDADEPYFGSMGLADKKGTHRPAWDVLIRLVKNLESK